MANRDTEVNNLIINELTKAEFDSAEKSETELYFVTDEKVQISEVEGLTYTLGSKQDLLVSGTNIKTINGEDVLGEGDLKLSTYHPPILSCMWSDHIINDIQFLRADTFSWQSGDVYVTAYNKLVEEYSTGTTETEGSITFKRTSNGFKIADSSQEQAILSKYDTDGIAWYYILDTENKRFKLPRTKFGFEGLRDTVGNDVGESLPNITGSISTTSQVNDFSGCFTRGTNNKDNTANINGSTNSKYIFDASLSSSTYQDNAPVQERATQMYLYFYVGEYTREAIVQTAGITTEQLNNKVDIDSSWGFPSNRYIDLTLGASGSTYTAPANGWYVLTKAVASNGDKIVWLENQNNGYSNISHTTVAGNTLSATVKIKKGQQIKVIYTADGITQTFRFIYAEGSN